MVKEEQLRDTQTPGYSEVCAPNCYCRSFTDPPNGYVSSMQIADCADKCFESDFPGFIFSVDDNGATGCRCCRDVTVDEESVIRSGNTNWKMYAFGASASAMGDPHITTLDGKHYTLLSQGYLFPLALLRPGDGVAFRVWHQENSQSIGKCTCTIRATSPSRRACFSSINQEDPSDKVLEITSQDCKWKARKGNGDWKVIDNAELSIPDGKGLCDRLRPRAPWVLAVMVAMAFPTVFASTCTPKMASRT